MLREYLKCMEKYWKILSKQKFVDYISRAGGGKVFIYKSKLSIEFTDYNER